MPWGFRRGGPLAARLKVRFFLLMFLLFPDPKKKAENAQLLAACGTLLKKHGLSTDRMSSCKVPEPEKKKDPKQEVLKKTLGRTRGRRGGRRGGK